MADLKLTKNQTLVLSVLEESSIPLSAYTILERLGEHGLRAPPQVYRALDKLLDLGLAHKLASMNSFLACQHTQCGIPSSHEFRHLRWDANKSLRSSIPNSSDSSIHSPMTSDYNPLDRRLRFTVSAINARARIPSPNHPIRTCPSVRL